LPKAQYAVGYFTEMGIGCRQDPLEANARYVKAADAGDERAIARLKIINEAASGAKKTTSRKLAKKSAVKEAKTPDKKLPLEGGGDKGDCTIM
jgi:TPR repeat protein